MFETPVCYRVGRPRGVGPLCVFWAMAIAFSMMAVIRAWLFRRGTWKLKRV